MPELIENENITKGALPPQNQRDYSPNKSLLSELVSRSYPSYKLELKIRKDYSIFTDYLEEKIKRESIKKSYKSFKQKNKATFIYQKKGLFLLKPVLEVKIKVKKTDHKSFFLTLKGTPLSYSYQSPQKYINKLLVSILS